MQNKANQSRRSLLMVFLLLILFAGLAPIRVAQAAVTESFNGFTAGASAESLTIAGVSAIFSTPAGSSFIYDSTGTATAPFVGNALLNNSNGGTLTIDFSQAEASYAFDYATNVGDGSDLFSVTGYRNGGVVFTDTRPVTLPTLQQGSISGSAVVFDRLVITSTTQDWAIDNLATTDSTAAGVTIVQTGGSTTVNEAGATTDTYQLKLDSVPGTSVTINLSNSDGQCTVTPSVTFAGGSSAAQTVTVTAVNDTTPETTPHNCVITHTVNAASDPAYTGVSIPNLIVNVNDNDTVGIQIVESGGSSNYTEGGTGDTYTIVLTGQPTADVIITGQPDAICDSSEGPGVAVQGTFTPSNWNVPQIAGAAAMDDFVAQGPHTCVIQHTLQSTDARYNNMPVPNVTVNVTDNDTAGVTITQSDGTTAFTEGGSDTYTIVLTSQPTTNVTVRVTPGTDCAVGGAAMGAFQDFIFTGGAASETSQGNWGTAQTVTVTGNDSIDQGVGAHNCTINHTVTSTDTVYSGIVPTGTPVVASITDNDTAGVMITQSDGTTAFTEGGSDSYTIVLTSQPTANVTITATPGAQCAVGGAMGAAQNFVFTTANWNAAQTVTVTGDDSIDQGAGAHNCTINHAVTSTDTVYSGIAPTGTPVVASITDNDTAGVTIAQSGGTTAFTEGGSDSYTIVLISQPTASVTVAVAPGAQCNVGSGMGIARNVIFTTGNWNSPQTVTVSAVDDTTMQGSRDCTINHTVTSTDTLYNGIAPSGTPVVAHITDNDAGVIITQSGGSTDVVEGGATDSYTLVLNLQPGSNVTVTATPDTECSVGLGASTAVTIVFTSANWNTPQSVTVTAINDTSYKVGNSCTIAHSVSSADPAYNPAPILGTPVIAHITDNDVSALGAAPKRNYFTTFAPTLTWNPVTWAIRYEVQVSSTSSFSVATTTTYQPGNALSLVITPALATNGTYYWRVRACKSATACGTYSPADIFTVR